MKIFVTSDAGSLTPMDKWEYQWVESNPPSNFKLNEASENGWEAVSSVSVFGGSMWRWCTVWVLMKRKVLKAES